MKLLFLLKKNLTSGGQGDYTTSAKSGLSNSANLVASALKQTFINIQTKVEVCVDGNSIDKELHLFKPRVCFIEAIWVTPAKLRELTKLHKKVLFIVRVHSKTTFLANEGVAIEWIKQYDKIHNVYVSFNNNDTNEEFRAIGIDCIYLPNLYLIDEPYRKEETLEQKLRRYFRWLLFHRRKEVINIGCFGAIRPMKNQLQQALAAIRFGEKYNYTVHFHVNAGRTEQKGDNALKNMRALFKGTRHKLIEHGWLNVEDFKALINKMDLGMQVSLTESFNIVSADFIAKEKPILVSKNIDWAPSMSQVDTEDSAGMADKLNHMLNNKRHYTDAAIHSLVAYNGKGLLVWERFLLAVIGDKVNS